MPRRVFPEIIVDRVVKEKGFKVFELGAGIIEKGLNQIDIGVHRPPPIVDGQNDLEPVLEAPIEDNLNLPQFFIVS